MDAPKITDVKIDQLREADWNPRKDYGAMPELEASIRERGILNPLQVRLAGAAKTVTAADADYEVFCGHRRLRAAEAVGLETVPCIVRPCTDQEAHQLAIIDNLQREDLGPMDEALAFGQLRDLGLDEAEIAARCVPERAGAAAYVHTRLALLELPKDGQAALQRGELPLTVAAAILRCGPDQRAAALKLVKEAHANAARYGTDQASAAHTIRTIKQQFMLSLKDAQFDPADETLVPRGACGPCTYRTGNQGALFGDFEGEDRCTDAKCFRLKLEKTFERRAAAAKKQGLEVIAAKDAKKLFPYRHSGLDSHQYVPVDGQVRDSKHLAVSVATVLKSAGDQAPKPILVQSPYDGSIHQVVKREAVEKLVTKRAADDPKAAKAVREERLRKTEAERSEKIDAEFARLLGERIASATETAAADVKVPKKIAGLVAIAIAAAATTVSGESTLKRRQLLKAGGSPWNFKWAAHATSLSVPRQLGLLAELLLEQEIDQSGLDYMKGLGIDMKALRKEAETTVRAAEPPAAAEPTKPSAKKGKRKAA